MSKRLNKSEEELEQNGIILLKDVRGRAACAIEGTSVLLKEGLEKNIEDIKVFTKDTEGDVLMAMDGSYVYPVAMIAGPETEFPTVEVTIKTEQNRYQIEVSKWHSFLRNHYSMVQAYLLRPGDKMMTATGEGTIESINYKQYTGEVWNVFLGSEEFKNNLGEMTLNMIYTFRKNSLLGLRPKQHIILTNGVGSGSYVMQMQLIEFVRDGFNINNFA